jgi:hypothetical protein
MFLINEIIESSGTHTFRENGTLQDEQIHPGRLTPRHKANQLEIITCCRIGFCNQTSHESKPKACKSHDSLCPQNLFELSRSLHLIINKEAKIDDRNFVATCTE